MTSPTGKQQKPQPSAKLEAMEVLEQTAAALHYKAIQLQRTLWLAATQAGGSLTLDESKMDLLWKLGFVRTPEGHLKVEASTMPEAEPADIERMVKDLTGTNCLDDRIRPGARTPQGISSPVSRTRSLQAHPQRR